MLGKQLKEFLETNFGDRLEEAVESNEKLGDDLEKTREAIWSLEATIEDLIAVLED